MPFHAAVSGLCEKALAGRREACLQVAELTALAERLGIHLDLWAMQNALWDVVRRGAWPHDRDSLSRLSQALWFDAAVLLRRQDPPRASA